MQGEECCHAQLNASSASACQEGRLRLDSGSLAQIFIASTAELPGLLLAALVMDYAGRKWCLHFLGNKC